MKSGGVPASSLPGSSARRKWPPKSQRAGEYTSRFLCPHALLYTTRPLSSCTYNKQPSCMLLAACRLLLAACYQRRFHLKTARSNERLRTKTTCGLITHKQQPPSFVGVVPSHRFRAGARAHTRRPKTGQPAIFRRQIRGTHLVRASFAVAYHCTRPFLMFRGRAAQMSAATTA